MSLSVEEAGRLGGLALLEKRGREYFVELGKKGQQSMRSRYPDMASNWGRKGGRPRKTTMSKRVGDCQ